MGVRFLLMYIMKILIGILCLSSSYVFCEMQQEIGEAVPEATNRFKARHPNPEDCRFSKLKDQVSLALVKVRKETLLELKKHLPIADPRNGDALLKQVKHHYESRINDPEMTQEKLWYLSTCGMRLETKTKWLEKWNQSAALREAVKFPLLKFSDASFPEWLKRATWWDQVCIVAFCADSLFFSDFLQCFQFSIHFVFVRSSNW